MIRVRLSVLAFVIANSLACGANLAAIDDAVDPKVAAALSKCRGEGRAAMQTAPDPKSKEAQDAGLAAYEACKKREGVDK